MNDSEHDGTVDKPALPYSFKQVLHLFQWHRDGQRVDCGNTQCRYNDVRPYSFGQITQKAHMMQWHPYGERIICDNEICMYYGAPEPAA